jgi:hypothetical protein
MNLLKESAAAGELLTGLFYINSKSQPLEERLELSSRPLTQGGEEVRPSAEDLTAILKAFA